MDADQKKQVEEMIKSAIEAAGAFATKKVGDTPTDAIQLTPKSYVDNTASVLNASIIGVLASIAGVGNFNIFGPGIHSVAAADSVNSIAGIVPSSSIYTLDKDVFFTNLTLSNNAIIKTNGYRVFANGTITIGSGSAIRWNGNNASSAIGGASLLGVTVPTSLSGENGGAGGPSIFNGNGQPGSQGGNGTATTNSLGGSSTAPAFSPSGGTGGNASAKPGGTGGYSGSVATATVSTYPPYTLYNFETNMPWPVSSVIYTGSASAPAGGGGGGGASDGGISNNSGAGGSGGGAGGNGGFVVVFANHLINNATGGLSSNGGNGAPGVDGGNGQHLAFATGGGGGGGGGNGGTGGVILLVYRTSVQSGTFTTTGGSPGEGGYFGAPGSFAGGTYGTVGKIGNTGGSGKVWTYQV